MNRTNIKLILAVAGLISSCCSAATPAIEGISISLINPTTLVTVQTVPCQIKKSRLDSRLKLEMSIDYRPDDASAIAKVVTNSKILRLQTYFSEEEPLESLKCQRINWNLEFEGRKEEFVFFVASADGFLDNPIKENESFYIEESGQFAAFLLQNKNGTLRLVEITDPLKWKEVYYKFDNQNGIEKRGELTDYREWELSVEEIDVYSSKSSPKKTLRFCRRHKKDAFSATLFFKGIDPSSQRICYYFNRSVEDPLLYRD